MRKRLRLPKANSQRIFAKVFESLEKRTLFASASSVFNVDHIYDGPTNGSLSDFKNGLMSNVSPDLTELYIKYRKFRNAGGKDADFQFPATNEVLVAGTRVGVTIRTFGTLADATELVRSLKGVILYRTNTFKAIDAMIPLTQLHSLAANPIVASVNPIHEEQTSQAGSANNQADETQLADLVYTTYGLTGEGIKIGVISDSVNQVGLGIAGSIATGDLPAEGVDVITDLPAGQGGTDEGRAMLEMIHDIVPNAELAFATAVGGQQVFADAIRALRDAGCDVIVDDIGYFAEPYFQPGVIDRAISDVVAAGAVYLSAAGNSANTGYETPVTFTGPSTARVVDWNTGPGTDNRLRIDVSAPGNVTMFIQWDNPYNGIAGNVATDLDVYNFNPSFPTRVVDSGTANNFRTGVPLETIIVRPGRNDIQINVAGTLSGRPLPTRIKFVIPDATSMTVEYPGTQAAIYGHSGGEDTISIGAVPFTAAPPYSNASPIFSEDFSSYGPVTRIFDENGNRLPNPVIEQKPDISGIDGTNTSFFGTDSGQDTDVHPNFSGTSAAAPNVAAVVVMMLEAAPNATQSELLDALKSSARPLNGSIAGDWDEQGGFGLIHALNAIEQFVTAPTVEITSVTPNPIYEPVEQVQIVFSQQVNGFDVSDVILSRDGGINLLTGLNSPTTTDGGRTWLIPNLEVVTDEPGFYVLTVEDSDGNLTNTVGMQLDDSDAISFTVREAPDEPRRPTNLRVSGITSNSVTLSWKDNSGTNEQGFLIQRGEDENFSHNVKNFKVGEDITTFTDKSSGLGGKTLYYRVRAFNIFDVNSQFSNIVNTTVLSQGEVVLDNDATPNRVTIEGTWDLATGGTGYLGETYLDDQNVGKGENTVRFTPNIQTSGQYFVYARWTRASNRATNVPIDIFSAGGKKTITVNQRGTGGSGWVLLGKFKFNKGTNGSVLIRTDGTDGKVIADSVRFLPAG